MCEQAPCQAGSSRLICCTSRPFTCTDSASRLVAGLCYIEWALDAGVMCHVVRHDDYHQPPPPAPLCPPAPLPPPLLPPPQKQDTETPSLGHMAHHLVSVPKWQACSVCICGHTSSPCPPPSAPLLPPVCPPSPSPSPAPPPLCLPPQKTGH
jgi:hypothetical protein